MGMIINIDEALKLRTDYNVLKEPLHKMLQDRQEAWEKENPIDFLYVRGSISSFQETYTSSIGFDHAFKEVGDYAVGPIFNTAEGFAATYRTRTFQGGFIVTQQALEDRQVGKIRDDANAFMKRWHGDIVEYSMAAIAGGFGVDSYFEGSRLRLNSADTVDGRIENSVQNPLFSKKHTIVRREGMTDTDISNAYQSNLFYADIDLAGDDAGKLTKLADAINQVITIMENYKDDNNKYAGVDGVKDIVTSNDPRIKGAIRTILDMEMFKQGESMYVNQAYKRANLKVTPYLNDIAQCKIATDTKCARGIFIVDKAYNAANHGPELTERIPLTLDVIETKRPRGITYDGRQRFDINCASWRGIAYLYLGVPAGEAGAWDAVANFTQIVPNDTIVKEVRIVNGTADPVNTKSVT